MGWREAARLSGLAFAELSLQAIYAFRQGNPVPPGPAHALAARARRRVLESKAIVSAVLAFLAAGAAFLVRAAPLASGVYGTPVRPGVFDTGVVTGLLSLDLAFLWWTGMQILPTFLSSGVLPVLEPLPIDERTLRRAAALLYVRLFDLPALTVLVGTPLALGVALGPLVGLAVVPGALAAVAFALALSLLTGRFFVRRVQGSRGGGGRTIVRWAYLVLWLLPAFAVFAFVTAAPALFDLLGHVGGDTGPFSAGRLLLVAFPVPLAVLPAVAATGPGGLGLGPAGTVAVLGACAGYGGLAVGALAWVAGSVARVGHVPVRSSTAGPLANEPIRARRAAFAVLVKDLRIASRTPGYAFVILLPILDALAIGLYTFGSAPSPDEALGLALGAVATAALVATFFGPAFFAIEVFAYSYGRTLPVTDRSVVLGKVGLVVGMYLAAAGIVLGFTLARVFDPALFAVFVLAELPAVGAAALFELGVLFWRARTKGLPITNLYSGAWVAALVAVPGVVIAGLPLLAFRLLGAGRFSVGLEAMALVAIAELAVVGPLALGRRER